ncbi:adenylyl-sulfate kinase [Candidatus Pantoea edessiphila]|uniref:Adenylyl-sulfate kinase n=1 Tax=Candidatus Pantoea edessiphila TaxID=2044610 RepID=A0A2P5SVS2_9GAMM|nr:adenylyl-sulfate kinase [Candidatus Pantoea edessiphila]PPI86429.1 adenylyl-sulfate kinase [Candidatus Pantoea edessiphila]
MKQHENIVWHHHMITRQLREIKNKHRGVVLWFTGLSGSGKSTIANFLEKELYQMNINTYLLDGDNLRHGLCSDLGFSDLDRIENIRRIGEVTKLMIDAGLLVLTAFISPYRNERRIVRNLFNRDQFIEIFVNTPLKICESRDPKGLYKKARAGKLINFTGIDSQYEIPEQPEIKLNGQQPVGLLVIELIKLLNDRNII